VVESAFDLVGSRGDFFGWSGCLSISRNKFSQPIR